jgi:hypothetical protein
MGDFKYRWPLVNKECMSELYKETFIFMLAIMIMPMISIKRLQSPSIHQNHSYRSLSKLPLSPRFYTTRIHQGTQILEKLPTSLLQQTHLSKLFIAKLTLQSSHRLKHLHGQTMIVLGVLWQTTHMGPSLALSPSLSLVTPGDACEERADRAVMMRCSRI